MRNIAVVAFAAMLLSCKGSKNPYIDGETITYDTKDVPEYTLSKEQHMTHEVFMGRMSIVDDYVLFCDLYADDSIFTVYNLDVTERLASFGTKGQGPNDFTATWLTNQNGVDNGEAYTWINDVNAVKLKRLNISKSIKEGAAVVDKAISTLPLEIECFRVTDSLVALKKISGKDLLIERYNPVTMETVSSVSAFDYHNDLSATYYVFNSSDIYDEYNDRYVSAMYSINQINFVDANTDMYAVCVGEVTPEDEMWDKELEDAKMQFYADLIQTDRYLLALYLNKRVEDIDEGTVEGPVEVHVFTKEGKLVALLKMDEYFTQIGLDKYGRLYGADNDSNIYRYKLPEELV